MCGRFAYFETDDIADRYSLGSSVTIPVAPHYNIAPGYTTPIIIHSDMGISATIMKWGFIPFWSKTSTEGYKHINTRAETVFEKPAWKTAILRNRCLIPTNGFYEWNHHSSRNTKQPYFIRHQTERVMSFAGIYSLWQGKDEENIYTFSILTTEANNDISPIHNRMPVIIEHAEEKNWLNPTICTPTDILPFLHPIPQGILILTPVSTRVNNAKHDDPYLITAIPVSN